MSTLLRQHAEQIFAEELEELQKNDSGKRPANWKLSPQAVVTYLVGGKLKNKFEVSPQFLSNLGVPVFACTPDKFPDLMAAAISKQDINLWAAKEDLVLKK